MKSDKQALKQNLKSLKKALCQEFSHKTHSAILTQKLVDAVDTLLIALFQQHGLFQSNPFCLVVIGGYGRRELQLHSDIDILLLHQDSLSKDMTLQAEAFIQDCWDLGFELSHQLTTVSACAELASRDLTVISSLLDMHLLCGCANLFEKLTYQIHPLHMWSGEAFFLAKQDEQKKRYEKYGETAYNLEPNVKNGPGGLRDLQILSNISKRHFGTKKLTEVIPFGFITHQEYDEFIHCQQFLWRVRFALHLVAEKKEDRLLFNYQIKIAALFGYHDTPESLAIEQFMKAYFKVIKRSRELNEILLQWFSEAIIHLQKQKITPLNADFQLANDMLEVTHETLFQKRPEALLELFLHLAENPQISGVRASTIRLIREHLYLIDDRFLSNPANAALFLSLFKATYDPYKALQRMNRYGVLAHYLKPFAAVTGQMQYDLFHAYTVDQHTLFVIRNLTRFLQKPYEKEFPLCASLMPKQKNLPILYLAALFHDIAKGRGGDHSELGEQDAKTFALQHALNDEETALLLWLVKHHLLLSHTAQRHDIYDPKTIYEFCQKIPNSSALDSLYLLTVADICATNPSLWNAWRDSLLKELYLAAKNTFLNDEILDSNQIVQQKKMNALKLLTQGTHTLSAIHALWDTFKAKYFLHESPQSIARHTTAILSASKTPLVLLMPHHTQGGTEVLIYMPHQPNRFSLITTVMHNHQTTIQEAMISTGQNQFDLDTFVLLDEVTQTLLTLTASHHLQQDLISHLSDPEKIPKINKRRQSRTQAHFKVSPRIEFSKDDSQELTRLFLITKDYPGLLAHLSRIFDKQDLLLHSAKVATAGERVEDTFYLSQNKGLALSLENQEQLKSAILNHIQLND